MIKTMEQDSFDFLLGYEPLASSDTSYTVKGFADEGAVEVQAIDSEVNRVELSCGCCYGLEREFDSRIEVLNLGTEKVDEETERLVEEFGELQSNSDFDRSDHAYLNVRLDCEEEQYELFLRDDAESFSIVGRSPIECGKDRIEHYVERTDLV